MKPIRRGTPSVLLAVTLAAACEGDSPRFPPAAPTVARGPDATAFVGADACRNCHQGPYEAWAGSTHGQAGGAPTPESVLAPFDGSPLSFSDATVLPRVQDGRWFFQVTWLDEVRELTVTAVIGGGHMEGGGTQGYVTEWPDGTVRFLPFDWSATGGFWFCNTNGRQGEGWRPIDQTMSLADCADWPPFRILGSSSRFQNCQGCHGSQIRVEREDGGQYHTEWTSLRIECESCHGPARDHVTWARGEGDGEPRMASLGTLTTEASLAVCDACHALKTQLMDGHWTGSGDLASYYSLGMAWLDGRPYTPDGQVASFAYQGTHRSSACYLDGAMSCTSCHEPHGQGYWDVNRRTLGSPFDDAQCTACHAAKAQDPEAHTLHPPNSEGARCVSCHMPYLQHPAVGDAVPFSRADHTVSIPRPSPSAPDSPLAPVDACTQCHEDWQPEDARVAVEAGWGSIKPRRPLVAALATAPEEAPVARAEVDPGTARGGAPERILRPDLYDPVAQLTLMADFAVAELRPGTPFSQEVMEGLWGVAASRDMDVQGLALAILHLAAGDQPTEVQRLARFLEPTSESDPLRRRWVASLTYLGDQWRENGRRGDALAAYRAGLELLPEQVYLLQAVGVLLREEGRPWLERAVEADPERPLTRVSLALFHQAAGNLERARSILEEATGEDPNEPLIHQVYGRVLAAGGDLAGARTALERAAELDWGTPDVLEDLMAVQEAVGDLEAARVTARRLLAFVPDHREALRLSGEAPPAR